MQSLLLHQLTRQPGKAVQTELSTTPNYQTENLQLILAV